jgi:hypothetical protein
VKLSDGKLTRGSDNSIRSYVAYMMLLLCVIHSNCARMLPRQRDIGRGYWRCLHCCAKREVLAYSDFCFVTAEEQTPIQASVHRKL